MFGSGGSTGSCTAVRARRSGSRVGPSERGSVRASVCGRALGAVANAGPLLGGQRRRARRLPTTGPEGFGGTRERSPSLSRTKATSWTRKRKKNKARQLLASIAPGWPSGQRRQTQDLLSQEFPGSNPGPGTPSAKGWLEKDQGSGGAWAGIHDPPVEGRRVHSVTDREARPSILARSGVIATTAYNVFTRARTQRFWPDAPSGGRVVDEAFVRRFLRARAITTTTTATSSATTPPST